MFEGAGAKPHYGGSRVRPGSRGDPTAERGRALKGPISPLFRNLEEKSRTRRSSPRCRGCGGANLNSEVVSNSSIAN